MVRTTLSKTTSNIFFNRKIQLPPLISGYVSHSIAPESSSNGPTKSTATPEEEERAWIQIRRLYYMMDLHHHGVGEAFNGGFIAGDEKNDVANDGGGETRDFLEL
ncbi:hypothetical protein F2Q68_00043773 [Brassica cretica]|uniref:Uncharacterized protein n=1 Tax=Brassica cretica TaxID=69181 RepID=A0A8S9LLT4_BRACR|nr:hypothetical protein F2Q68_00043773 [Brassica cretica]